METPFLDQLIEDYQNHIESVEASSYAGIQETRKQLAELEAIKAIIVTHCCKPKGNCKHEDYTPCYGREGELMFKQCDTCGQEFD